MSQQPSLLPTLHALVPPAVQPRLLAHLSLKALHLAPYEVTDSIYTATQVVLPGQQRNLRLRSVRRPRKEAQGGADTLSLTYLSDTLRAREYAEMNVRGSLEVDVKGMSTRDDVEQFIEVLGFRHSHTHTLKGHIIHLSFSALYPSLTLTVTICKLVAPGVQADADEPYFVSLQPCRAVPAVSGGRGEPGLQEVMKGMKEVASRIEGVEWSTGRP